MPRHDLDMISLIAGLLFGGAAVVFLMDQAFGTSGRWAWPVLLVVVGVAGLIASRSNSHRA